MQTVLLQRGLRLEYLTLAWNVVGSVIVVLSAVAAHSVALAGFGLDSLIEIFASLIVVWQLKAMQPSQEGQTRRIKGLHDAREQRALRLIGGAFFALALYVLVQSTYTLLAQARPDASVAGIVWLAATLVTMLLLAWDKGRTGKALGNPVLITESRVTLIDAYLAAAVLAGLVLNAIFGWWWADPIAGLVIVYYGLKEGREAWR